ncbi:MAG: helix-hairpin-helix domain-containing protein [Cyclobacteriaceae bacterium]
MFNRLSYFFRNYFGFSKSESRGSIVLIILLFISILLPAVIRITMNDGLSEGELVIADEPWLDSLAAALASSAPPAGDKAAAPEAATEPSAEDPAISLFQFDPNTATKDEFVKMGLPNWLADRIIKYRSKGGVFRVKDDLSKIYGMPEEQFAALRPFITLPEKAEKKTYTSYDRKKKDKRSEDPVDAKADSARKALRKAYAEVTFPFDINLADSIQLKALTGVGSKTANKILKARTSLGGFISLTQLEEIWGISDEALDELESKTFVGQSFMPVKINVNTATAEEIWEHPYLKRYQARAIVAYRQQHGNFEKADDLLAIKVIKKETLRKMIPYLEFDFLTKENSSE